MDSSYRKSVVNNTVCMFNFLAGVGKLTIVAGCLSYWAGSVNHFYDSSPM